jgi:phosphopantetheinyl transferase (holo-ACP synthase)
MKKDISFVRIVNTIDKEEFVKIYSSLEPGKWFSERELEIYSFPKNANSLAGRYLIKKAVCEHLNEGVNGYEIEILNNEFGKPEVFLDSKVRNLSELEGIKKICCSISHSRNVIGGMTILCY